MNTSTRLFATLLTTIAFALTDATAQQTADVNNIFNYLADSNKLEMADSDKRASETYTNAIFRGDNNQNVQAYFAKHLNFPETGISAGKSGSMKVWFEILPNGRVGDMRTENSPGAAFDAAVTKCLNDMPQWTPAFYGSTAVTSTHAVQLNFRLR